MALIPDYTPPDFSRPEFIAALAARWAQAPADCVLPQGFHATSNPILGHHNRTARLAAELVASLFSKRIL